jgi:hypothetical protein
MKFQWRCHPRPSSSEGLAGGEDTFHSESLMWLTSWCWTLGRGLTSWPYERHMTVWMTFYYRTTGFPQRGDLRQHGRSWNIFKLWNITSTISYGLHRLTWEETQKGLNLCSPQELHLHIPTWAIMTRARDIGWPTQQLCPWVNMTGK